jgi:hypothetical protein
MQITISKGQIVLIDDEDEPLIRGAWYITGDGYAARSRGGNKNHRIEYMHRIVTRAPKGTYVDHINGDKLDNRKSNLRLVTNSENMQNLRGAYRTSRTGIRGVSPFEGRFRATVVVNYKQHHIGLFDTIDEAAAAATAARKALMTHSPECEEPK